MRIWRWHSQPRDHQPTITSRGSTPDEAFDNLARAAGESTNRRGALKVLLLGVGGAAVGGGVLVASASTSTAGRRSTAQIAGITTCNSVIPGQCCTHDQLKACEKAAGDVFMAAVKHCAPECTKNKQSAACKTCAEAVAAHTVTAYQSCVGRCATAASTGTSPLLTSISFPVGTSLTGRWRQSSATSNVALYSAGSASADPGACNYGKAAECAYRKERDTVLKLIPAAIGCSAAITGVAIAACVAAVGTILAMYQAGLNDCAVDAGCPRGTYCTPVSVCCPPSLMGCPCGSGGCCVDTLNDTSNCGKCLNACNSGEDCILGMCTCGFDLCPAPRICCNRTCCSLGAKCCEGQCCDTTCCNDICCESGQICCGGTCCDTACCGGLCCPAGVPCVSGECTPPTPSPSVS